MTIRDVARLVPSAGAMGMEPSGWMVVGLPTNFYATAPVEVVGATILGQAAEVRFTASSFAWNYGDGASLTTADGGSTWAALAVPEFSNTVTSHVYRAPGRYTITLSVSYSAEYRIGASGWQELQGTVPSVSPPLTATAAQGKTVLVPGSCARAPLSPGC
ncbi:PKD domain-containing protein [Agreia sp. COWG]|uniref:PKD domain-containing protein n=1 Tax=Agreia sp. COWG TaxID=2773266 RepID=UPI001F2699C1|nr:PKD domain-containing protein [Agreia sp. COWG]